MQHWFLKFSLRLRERRWNGCRAMALVAMLLVYCHVMANGRFMIVDSLTHAPVAGASVFDNQGRYLGSSDSKGWAAGITASKYPLIVRCMGYKEKAVQSVDEDTVFVQENVMELPEMVVETSNKKRLHILAYTREYSTLASFTDTVIMFREKLVDFMLPAGSDGERYTWRSPRILNCKSYYRFTNAAGLDSVSDRCNHHFSWSDWIGIPQPVGLPEGLVNRDMASDTLSGAYSPAEVWNKSGDCVGIDVDVLAHNAARRWVPGLTAFFRNESMEFERFKLRMNYGNVVTDEVGPLDLVGYSFNIESRGRGHNMFQFNRHDQPFYVSTYTEVYILDKEFITLKEAKKWDRRQFDASQIEILEPMEAPELQPSTLAMIERVNRIDADQVRLTLEPDYRLMSRNVSKRNFGIGRRALFILKQMTGISAIRGHRNLKRDWREFRREQNEHNRLPDSE